MPPKSSKMRAAAARADAGSTPIGTTAQGEPVKMTVSMPPDVWVSVGQFAQAASVARKRRIGIGPIGAALYAILTEDPDLQERVLKRL